MRSIKTLSQAFSFVLYKWKLMSELIITYLMGYSAVKLCWMRDILHTIGWNTISMFIPHPYPLPCPPPHPELYRNSRYFNWLNPSLLYEVRGNIHLWRHYCKHLWCCITTFSCWFTFDVWYTLNVCLTANVLCVLRISSKCVIFW